jgi:hypothetical protein
MRRSARPSRSAPTTRVEFYSEFLDVARFPGEEQQQRRRDFFADKYRQRPPDLVIAVSGGALVFLTGHRTELFAGVPIVYCSVTGDPHPVHLSDAGTAEVLSGGSARWHGMDPFCFRALGSKSTRDAGLGAGTHERHHDHGCAGGDCSWRGNLGIGST